MQVNLKRNYVQEAIIKDDLEEFMKWLFDFSEDPYTRPAKSTLSSLCEIKNADKSILRILANSNKLDLNYTIRGPNQSYWDFRVEKQLISYLYYFGALTHAEFFKGNHKCSVIIPNNCAEKEYFDALSEKINTSAKCRMETALKEFFNDNDIAPVLQEIEEFYKEYSKPQSGEDEMDWSIFLLLKMVLENQIERPFPLKENLEATKTFYDNFLISPSSHPHKMFVIEEKSISFQNIKKGLIKYFKKKNQNVPDLMQESWNKLSVYQTIVYKENLLTKDVLSDIDIQDYDSEKKQTVTISYAEYLKKAKEQIDAYAKMISEIPKLKDKEIIKFLIIRCGPSKIFEYKI